LFETYPDWVFFLGFCILMQFLVFVAYWSDALNWW
jgi:hypothetical protein